MKKQNKIIEILILEKLAEGPQSLDSLRLIEGFDETKFEALKTRGVMVEESGVFKMTKRGQILLRDIHGTVE